jgi:hypothetical protein
MIACPIPAITVTNKNVPKTPLQLRIMNHTDSLNGRYGIRSSTFRIFKQKFIIGMANAIGINLKTRRSAKGIAKASIIAWASSSLPNR